jgi:hypothetical protein
MKRPIMVYEECRCSKLRRVLRLHWHRLYWQWPERDW